VMGLYAITIIKNFTDPDNEFVTSREKTFARARARERTMRERTTGKGRRGKPKKKKRA
jgi:hypothetical protein